MLQTHKIISDPASTHMTSGRTPPWMPLLNHYRTYRADHRATTVFVCASQPHAGDFLRAIPTDPSTTISSAQLLVLLQRRLALPLHPVPTPPHDPYGDSLQNEGCHTFRHDLVKERWYDAFTDTFGASLSDLDPRDGSHESYSPGYRPDLVAFYQADDQKHLVCDVKVVSPFTKGLSQQDRARTAAVAFANTEERLGAGVDFAKSFSKFMRLARFEKFLRNLPLGAATATDVQNFGEI